MNIEKEYQKSCSNCNYYDRKKEHCFIKKQFNIHPDYYFLKWKDVGE